MASADLDGSGYPCNEISCQWDQGRIERWYFEQNRVLIAVAFSVLICFKRIIANPDYFLLRFINSNPLVLVFLELGRNCTYVHREGLPLRELWSHKEGL